MPEDTIGQAVNDAVESLQSEDVKQEDTKELPASTDTNEEDAKLDERTTNALQLLDALEDPARARKVVENLARQAGLLDPGQTKQEQRQTVKSIKEIVKEKLGENGSFIASELGDALQEILEEHKSTVRKEIEDVENRRQAALFEKEYSEAIAELKVTDTEAVEVSKLVDEMPWNGRTPLKNYLTKIVRLHRSEAAEKSRKEETRQKQQRNINAQTKTSGVESNEDRIKNGSGVISAREAVLAAMRQEKLD